MRGFRIALLCAALLVCAIGAAQAEDSQIVQDGVRYTLDNGYAFAEEYIEGAAEVVIPQAVQGLPVSLIRIKNMTPLAPRLVLAEGVTQVTDRQFMNCPAKELVLPSTLTEIGKYAFAWMNNLSALTIPDGITSIGEGAFGYCAIESISLPASVTYIAPRAFARCGKLQSFAVHPDNPVYTAINGALYSKDGKTLYCFPEGYGTAWTMPDGTETIDEDAFGENWTLKTLILGEGIRELNRSDLSHCFVLTALQLPATIERIGEDALPLYRLKTLEVPQENPYYRNVDGSVYSIEDSTLIFHPRGKDTVYSVLLGTKRISTRAFAYDQILQSVSLPHGLEEIGSSAFSGCIALQSMSMPLTLTHISEYAFYDCIELERLALPPGLLSIGRGAFMNCSGMSALHIPASIREIGENAFYDAPQMTITADPGTVGEAHVRVGKAVADPLGIPYFMRAGFPDIPVTACIVSNPGTDDLLPLYASADTGADIIGSYPNGTTALINEFMADWLYVSIGHTYGYLQAEHVIMQDTFHTLFTPKLIELLGPTDVIDAPHAIETGAGWADGGTLLNTAAACGTWYQVVVNGEMAFLPTNQAAVVQYIDHGSGGQYGVVENPNPRDRLHLRDSASTDGKSLARFFNGTQVEIISEHGDWYHVRVAEIEGYMMAKHVRKVFNR